MLNASYCLFLQYEQLRTIEFMQLSSDSKSPTFWEMLTCKANPQPLQKINTHVFTEIGTWDVFSQALHQDVKQINCFLYSVFL